MPTVAMALECSGPANKSHWSTRVRRSLIWSGGVLALLAALLLRHSLLLQWRPALMLLVFGITPIVLLFLLQHMVCSLGATAPRRKWAQLGKRGIRQNKGNTLAPRLREDDGFFGFSLVLWLSALLVAASQQGEFLWQRHQVLHSSDALSRQIGAHLVIGYSDAAAIKTLAERGLIGGIFIGSHNVSKRSRAAIHAEISLLQAARQAAGWPPLIIATDQEGGIVSRVSPPLIRLPSLAEVLSGAKADEIETLAFAYGEHHGRDLAALGINVNFAPLADLSSPDRHQRLDFRSLIGRRAIDTDPARVSSAVIGYAHGLEAAGVRATLKHFPGLGRVNADTHVFSASLTTSERELENSDWIPFRQGLQATSSLLMVGHATLSAVDNEKPASLSRQVIDQIVRQRWGHDGILITDDLSMGPVVRHGLCQAGVDAINAGIDLLLVSYDTEQYFTVFHCLQQAARANTIDQSAFKASQQRLGALHRSIGVAPDLREKQL